MNFSVRRDFFFMFSFATNPKNQAKISPLIKFKLAS
jgi:hypothetical protein